MTEFFRDLFLYTLGMSTVLFILWLGGSEILFKKKFSKGDDQ
jgi:hypothetical protein